MVNRTNRGKGLTLSEILVSIVLLTLLLVTTLVLFTQLLTNTTKSGFVNTASVYADQVLEEAIAAGGSRSCPLPWLRACHSRHRRRQGRHRGYRRHARRVL